MPLKSLGHTIEKQILRPLFRRVRKLTRISGAHDRIAALESRIERLQQQVLGLKEMLARRDREMHEKDMHERELREREWREGREGWRGEARSGVAPSPYIDVWTQEAN